MIRILILTLFFVLTQFRVQAINDTIQDDSIQLNRLLTVVGTGGTAYLSGLSYLRFIWYRDRETVPFHFYDDSKGYLQMDKCGHAYAAYFETIGAYHAFRWSGMKKNEALFYGGLTGFLFQTPIEIFDGLYEGWGFSWTDMIANTAGSLIFISQEAFLDEQVVKMKFSYSPSGYPKYHSILGENELESFFLDYNGHTYWLSLNLDRITTIDALPDWLNLAVGYSANGMIKEFGNPSYYQGKPFPHLDRYRQYIISLDVDLSKIKTDKVWLKRLLNALNMLKIPFPAVEFNSLGETRFYPVYF